MSGNSFTGTERSETTRENAAGVFLSYRRGDKGARVGRLYDRLVSRFGKTRVFRDIDSALPAANFELVIDHALAMSGVLIAVIGPNWQTVTNARGERRLDDPKDYVRYEIARALKNRQCQVLPILHGADTMMPAADDLPEDLRPIVTLQAIRVDNDDEGPHFEFDAQQVVNAVARILGEPEGGLDPDIVLTPPDLVLEPGHSGQIAVVARNVGTTSTDVAVSYDGPDWARLAPDAESHAGGRELHHSLIVSPPRSADVPPRAWPYAIALRAAHDERPLAQASGTVTTVAFSDAHVHLEPARVETRRSAALTLTIANGGNVHMYGRVLTNAEGLNVEGPDRLTLEPGAEQTYPIVVSASARHLVGRVVERPVTVSVSVDDEPDPHVRRATVSQRPIVPVRAIVLMAVLLLGLLGFGTRMALHADAESLPDVIAQPEDEAVEELKDAGWEEVDVRYVPPEPDKPAGYVVRTDPEPGAETDLDESVEVYVAKESTVKPLPDVAGLTQAQAEEGLRAAGFTNLSVELEQAAGAEPGHVVRTEPVANAAVPLIDAIVIFVAQEPATPTPTPTPTPPPAQTLYTIDDVRGLTWGEAVAALPGPLRLFDLYEPSDAVDEGLVIRTEPEIGTSHPADTRVDVFISTGPSTTSIPSVVGETEWSASDILASFGLEASTVYVESCEVLDGLVVGQTPDPGTEVDPGSTVEIDVAQEPLDGCG
jgi:beta-lactam-binding protein with PASTA domain